MLAAMDSRTRWMVVTGALIAGWAVAVALLVVAFAEWSDTLQAVVGGGVSGLGAALILRLRMKRLPQPPARRPASE